MATRPGLHSMSGVSPRVRQTVLERDGHTCTRCGTYVGPFGVFSVHHRRPRGMGGSKRLDTNQPANLLTLCGTGTTGCHGEVEQHRDQALSEGFLLFQSMFPDEQPVKTHLGWRLYDNEGSWSEVVSA